MGEPRRAVRRYRFVGDSAGGEERAVLVLRVPEVRPRGVEGQRASERGVAAAQPCVSGAGPAVWHVRVALRRGAGSVRVVSQENTARPQSAGGNVTARSACCITAQCSLGGGSREPQAHTNMHKHIPHFMHHFRVPPGQRSPPSSSPASLNSHICTSRPPFPAEQLHPTPGCTSPPLGSQGCQAAEPTQHPPPLHSQLPSVLSDRCRCEPTRNSSCQVRCSGDTVRQ